MQISMPSIIIFPPVGSTSPKMTWICWGFQLPHTRTGGVLILAQRRVKHTDTISNVVRQNRLHPRESPYYLEIRERIHYKYMEEEDHFTQTQLLALLLHLQLLQ